MRMGTKHIGIILLTSTLLTACTQSQYDRLKMVGQEPPMKTVDIPEEQRNAPISWPIARIEPENLKTANSLWKQRTKSFFGDQRAKAVGDILKVRIEIQDKAELDNKTERTRNGSDTMGAPTIFGLQGKLTKWLPGGQNPASLLDVSSNMSNTGEGIIEREEVIETEVAAVVTQVLENGNLVIYGTQEVRVNYEVRQLIIQGVVRAGDISPENMVDLSRVAEARVSYGGRGLISDVQQPRVGSQIIDILSPW